MILVDSSVWIDFYRGHANDQTRALTAAGLSGQIAVADLVLCEVLMGVADEARAAKIAHDLSRFHLVAIGSPEVATLAAAHFRALRRRGITIRGTIDLLIAPFCIAHGHLLLHRDRDFDAMEAHLGLRVVRA